MNAYTATKRVRFAHCDPAGIIFYPQYFVLLHEVKEDWFRDALGYDFAGMLMRERVGLPIVRLEADFTAPSRLGEELAITLTVARLGGASLHLHYQCACAGELRMRAQTMVVMASLETHKPLPIHDGLRAAIEHFMAKD